jgi:hypothetical protein
MRNFVLKQQILFALKQELNLEGQALIDVYYYFNSLNLGVKFYDFIFIDGKAFSFEIENDLKTLKPKQGLRYATKLDFFLSIAIQKIKNKGFELPKFEEYKANGEGFYTIGYEGISIDTYLERLLNNGIKALVDVRRNAYSNKFGFTKGEFSNALKKVGILYFHIPELGISAEKRDEAGIYEGKSTLALFESYEKELPSKQKHIEDLLLIYKEQKCIAITCFEKEPCNCHRSRLVKFLKIEFKDL